MSFEPKRQSLLWIDAARTIRKIINLKISLAPVGRTTFGDGA
jgi:hypothetical protein